MAMTSRRRSSRARSPNSCSRPAPPDGLRLRRTSASRPPAATPTGTPLSRSRSILRRSAAAAWLAAWAAVGLAGPAQAHGFGQRYELPLPLSLYLLAAGAAVVLSFVIFALFARHAPATRAAPRTDLLATPLGRVLASPAVTVPLKLITFCLFAVTIAAGIWGNPNPYRNIAPTLVWIVWWVGLVYLSALAGNIWA